MTLGLSDVLLWLALGLALGLPVGLVIVLVLQRWNRRRPPPPGPLAGIIALGMLSGLAFGAAPVASQVPSEPRLRLLAQHGGQAGPVLTQGDWAYVAEGPKVVAVDLAPTGTPRRAGTAVVLPGVVRRLVWWQGRLLALYRDSLAQAGNDGLAVLAVSGADISLVSRHPLAFGPRDLLAVGDRLWLTGFDAARGQTLGAHDLLAILAQAGGNGGFDLSQAPLREAGIVPTGPAPLTLLGDDRTVWLLRTLRGMAPEGTELVAYRADQDPSEAGRVVLSLSGRHSGAAVDPDRGLIALVLLEPARGRVRLALVDPAADPPERGAIELVGLRGCGGPLALSGTLAAFVDRCERRLRLLDLGDPAAPRALGSVAMDLAPEAMAWDGRRLVASGGPMGGLAVFDTISPDRPFLAASLPGLGAVGRLALHRDGQGRATLYGVDPTAGLWLLDPPLAAGASGAPPLAAPRLDLPQAANLALVGDTLVVGGWSEGLRPFDLSDARAPKALAPMSQAKAADSLLAVGDRIVEGLGTTGLQAIDVLPDGSLQAGPALQDPLIWQVTASTDGRLLGQGQGFAYELDPLSLTVANRWTMPPPTDAFKVNRADSLAFEGDRLHLAVAGYTHNPTTMDYADRLLSLRLPAGSSAAEALGQQRGGLGALAGRTLAGGGLLLTAGDGGLDLYRSGPAAPERLDRWASPGSGSDLLRWQRPCPPGEPRCAADLLFLSDGEAGLAVLAIGPDDAAPTTDVRCFLPLLQRRR